ncbi:MAG TPA: class I SAM-dependent methyltransferase [Actinomycetes bacterium]|jgi:SAM-dependent methyltransferase|nr:class I SAM-dependent methyltransferase [Actinomycetes bacterium]
MAKVAGADHLRWITANDLNRSRTSRNVGDLLAAIGPLQGAGAKRLLDIGCGYGGLAKLVGDVIGAEEVHGADIDEAVMAEARGKGVRAVVLDVGAQPLPYPAGHFDLVMSLGMMDYLPTFDGMIREIHRVVRPAGSVLIALPNLGSWHNRAMLLLGYQPRDIEISSQTLAGVPRRFYQGEQPAGHLHTATARAFTELMAFHGFRCVRLSGGRPTMRAVKPWLEIIDRAMTKRPTLARRFYYLGQKQTA